MRTFSTIRAAVVLLLLGLTLAGLIGRVAYLQSYGRQHTIRRADRQQYQTEPLKARRGSIYDACGNVLAGTVQTRSLFVDPHFMNQEYQREGHSLIEMDEAVAKLAKLLDRDAFELSKLLGDRNDSRFLRIADNLDEDTCKAIEEIKLKGAGLMAVNQRCYPMGAVAAHVLGGVGGDGAGLEAIELKYEKLLAGKDGFKRTLTDGSVHRRGIAVAEDDYLEPKHGHHLILTIDSNIQMIVEQELAGACEEFGAKRGEVIVLDPRSGEILALANYPTFNPQNLEDSPAEVRRNNALVAPFEPGSAIKPFIAGPALAWHITRPEERWPIPGISWNPYGSRRVTDVHGYPPLATWDVLVKSSNIGMSMLGTRMGSENIYRALRGFGFGGRTNIELPGEDPGLVPRLALWKRDHVISASQGYAIMVTPLQLARAFAAYANGGRLVEPHIVKGVLDADGNVVTLRPTRSIQDLQQAIDPQGASMIKRILSDVPVRGTATGAGKECPMWNIFGKTGTAHISEGRAGYSATRYNSTFLAGAPAENPRMVIAMTIHEVEKKGTNYYGGTVSGPPVARIFKRSLSYLQVPESPELTPPPAYIANVLFNFDPKVYHKFRAMQRDSSNARPTLTTASARD